MATASAEPKQESKVFSMPFVRMGDTVWWSASPNDDGFCAALVNKVGIRTVDLLVMMPNSPHLIWKIGVNHKNDPRNRDNNQDPSSFPGVWWARD